jgi:hypothetical protein
MIRLIVGIVAGLIAGFVTVFIAETIGQQLFPPSPGADASSIEGIKALIAASSTGSLVAVLVAWGLGTYVAATVALLVARRRRIAGWIAAGLLACASAATLALIPHPTWFVIGAVVVIGMAVWLADTLFAAKT